MKENKYTPMIEQYLEVKEANPDTILFYRIGDFYEMFFEDAKIASRELDLVLTGKNAGKEEKVPMCGIPHHAASSYIQRLIKKGYKVSICEQLEDPAQAKGIVKRGIIRTITPGTYMDEALALNSASQNHCVLILKCTYDMIQDDWSATMADIGKAYEILADEYLEEFETTTYTYIYENQISQRQ